VLPKLQPVVMVLRARGEVAFGGIFKPPGHILAHSRAPGIEDQPLVAIGERRSEQSSRLPPTLNERPLVPTV